MLLSLPRSPYRSLLRRRPRPAAARAAEVLEDRALLSATFALDAARLQLGGFTQVTDENLTVRENGANYEFVLSEGVWAGTDGDGMTGTGTAILSVDKSAVAGLAGGIDVDASDVTADVALQTADFSTLSGGLTATGAGSVTQATGQMLTVSSLDVSANVVALSGTTNGGVGNVTFAANRQVRLDGASLTTTSGRITMAAIRDSSLPNEHRYTVYLSNSSIATNSGTITLSSIAPKGTAVVIESTSVTSAYGDIKIVGRSLGLGPEVTPLDTLFATGVDISGNTLIGSTGIGSSAGKIDIEGYAGTPDAPDGFRTGISTNFGVSIRSVDGDISLRGEAYGGATKAADGISLGYGADITSTGIGPNAASISITGVVLAGNWGGAGVKNLGLSGSPSQVQGTGITAVDGDIAIHGVANGWTLPNTSYYSLNGITFFSGTVSASGTGHVALTGTAPIGDDKLMGSGIYLDASNGFVTEISAGEGGVSLYGQVPPRAGRNVGGKGVEIVGGSRVTAVNGGTVSLSGIGDNAPDILITGTVRSTGGGEVVMTADTFSTIIAPTYPAIGTIDAGSADVVFRNRTANRTISLGSGDAAAGLILSDAALDRVTAGRLVIGSATAGDILLAGPVTQAGSGYAALVLITGGKVVDATATEQTDLTVSGLTISAAGAAGVGGSGADLNLAVGHLTATAATIGIRNDGSLVIGDLSAATISIAVTGAASIDAGATLDVSRIDYTPPFIPDPPSVPTPFAPVWIFNDGTDAVTGTFAGLPEGTVVTTVGGRSVRVTYHGWNGNDVLVFVDSDPTVRPDEYRVREDRTISGNVLANDDDLDLDTLKVVAVNQNGSAIGIAFTLPSGATVSMAEDGTFIYDPNHAFDRLGPGESAFDRFDYTVSDGQGAFVNGFARVVVYGAGSSDLLGYLDGQWWATTGNVPFLNTRLWAQWPDIDWDALTTGDVNGDGRTDILGLKDGHWRLGFATPNGFADSVQQMWADADWRDVTLRDLNGDGKADLLARLGGEWWAALSASSGLGFLAPTRWAVWTDAAWDRFFVEDLDGDRKADLFGLIGGEWWAALSTGTSFGTASVRSRWGDAGRDAVGALDYNGDGRTDVYGLKDGVWTVGLWLGGNFLNESLVQWADVDWRDVRAGDFNGDGRDDIAARYAGEWWVRLSQPAGLGTPLASTSRWAVWVDVAWEDVRVGDFDADGRADLIGRYQGSWYAALSDGTKFNSRLYAQWADADWQAVTAAEVDPAVVAGAGGGALYAAPPAAAMNLAAARKTDDPVALFWSNSDRDEEFSDRLLAVG